MSELETVSTTQADATPSAPAAPATQVNTPALATPSTPQEDRSNWIPPDAFKTRLNETRATTARQLNEQFAAREAEIRAEAEQYRRQVLALTGVTPSNRNPEVEGIKSQFSSIFPGLATLEEKAAQLEALIARTSDIEAQNSHYWQSHGRQTVDRLFDETAKATGQPLTDDNKRFLHSSFVGFVQSSPELQERYANDPTLVNDFVKLFTSSFIDPARRTATTGLAARAGAVAHLPQDTSGGAPPTSAAPKPANMDEAMKGAWALFNSEKK